MGSVDLILCGKQAIDGDTAQVGPEMAEHLGMTQVTYANSIEVVDGKVRIEREEEEGFDIIETKLPLMATVIKLQTEPRFPTVKGTLRANRADIPVWTAADLDVDPNSIGLKGSPTQVRKIFTPERRTQGEIIDGDDARAAVEQLFTKLREAKIV